MAVTHIIKYRVTIWTTNSTPRYIPKRNENISSHKNLYITIHRSIIYNGPKVETTQISIDLWMNMVYSYNGILFSHIRKWSADTFYMHELRHIMLSEKSQTQRAHIVWFYLNEMSRICKYIKTESSCQGLETERNGEWQLMGLGLGFLFWVMKDSGIRLRWWMHNTVNLKATEIYNWKGWISWYMTYVNQTTKTTWRKTWSPEKLSFLSKDIKLIKWHHQNQTPSLPTPNAVL